MAFVGFGVNFTGQILGFRHVGVHPDFAVVRERCQQVALIHQAIQPAREVVHDATERYFHSGELHARLGQRHVGVGLVEFGLGHHQLAARYDVLIGQLIGVPIYDNQLVEFGLRPRTEQG